VQKVFSVADLKTHFVASNEVWDPGYESKENSGSLDRSRGKAQRQDRGCSNHPQP
jgi:hypothetical protein